MKKSERNRRSVSKSKLGALFVKKILACRPEGVRVHNWLHVIFGIEERIILRLVVTSRFRIPGSYKPVPNVHVKGIKFWLKKDKTIFVRFDSKFPDRIDLEAPIAHGLEVRMFQLTRAEFQTIEPFLTPTCERDRLYLEYAKDPATKLFPLFKGQTLHVLPVKGTQPNASPKEPGPGETSV